MTQSSEHLVTPDKVCAFCNRPKAEVRKIVTAATGVSICNDCCIVILDAMLKQDPPSVDHQELVQLREEAATLRCIINSIHQTTYNVISANEQNSTETTQPQNNG